MGEEYNTMSYREMDRLELLQALMGKQLRQREVAERLSLSVRQVKRLVARYRAEGAAGLVSRQRGKRPNNRILDSVRESAIQLVQTHYADFGPTLAREKLEERHGYQLSTETLRQWMMAEGLWVAKRRKAARIHQRRPRRPYLGELVQIDGSPHDWFEERGPRCTLIVFIDDATSRLMALHFVPAETTQAYMETLRAYLKAHGRPVALYSDKHSIFRVNHPDQEGVPTQFTRALQTLDIQAIHANSPQAKGRVERANQTLQDRLVKELRLQGISDLEAANAFLPEFLADYNRRFAVSPQHPQDAHRPVLHNPEELSLIFCLQHTRKLSKNLSFRFQNREYQLTNYSSGYRLRGASVTVCQAFDSSITLLYQGQPLTYRILAEGEPPIPLDDEKSLHLRIEQAVKEQAQRSHWKPAPDHPWRRYPQSKPAHTSTP
ncbi:ISNCY family transposase [Acidithiobacillus acidisediminis]|jgi:transposase|uniref:ISNCY family transposase n=1 Tax=Acidithiobacillus acidisediminis TaxID=2937799 RepID=UPI0031FE6071